MKFVLALALLVGVSAASESFGPSSAWSGRREFLYRFESEVLTGMPRIRGDQLGGLKLAADVRVQTENGGRGLRVKFERPRYVVVNEKLPVRNGRPVVPEPEQEVPAHMREALTTPFSVEMERGVVRSLTVDRSEPASVTNLKRALLSQLQLDLTGARRTEVDESGVSRETAPPLRGNENSYFTTEETSIVGDCETSYTVTPLPRYRAFELESEMGVESAELRAEGGLSGQRSRGEEICSGKEYFEIVKTRNFDHCKKRPMFQSAVGIKLKCDFTKNKCKDIMSQVSSTRYIACGSRDEFIIREAITTNSLMMNPLGWTSTPEKMISTARVSLFLVKVESGSYSPFPEPQQPKRKHSLIFEYGSGGSSSSDYSPSGHTNDKDPNNNPVLPKPDLHSASVLEPKFLSFSELRQQVLSEMRKVVDTVFHSPESCSSKGDVSGTIFTIAQYLRSQSYANLKEIERSVMSEFQSEKRKVATELFYETISMIGTNPSVMLIKEKLERKELEGNLAENILMATIRGANTPTTELMKEMLQMIKSLRDRPQLYNTGLTHMSNLIYRACIDPDTMNTHYPTKIYGKFCDKHSSFIQQEYIRYLIRELESCQDHSEKLILITSLGKVGHRDVLYTLSKAIEGKLSHKSIVKSVAVYSLKRLAKQEPIVVRPILLALIDNPVENTEVRIAAIAILPYTQPSMAELQKVAVRSWFEPSKQVSSFIYSMLSSLPKTEVPELKAVGLKAKNLLSLVKPHQYGIQFSKESHSDIFVKYLLAAASGKFSYVNTEDALSPSKWSLSSKLYGGSWELNWLTFNMYTQGMDLLIEKMSTYLSMREDVSQEVREKLIEIDHKLNIQKRSSEDAETLLHFNMLGFERMLPIDSRFYAEIIAKVYGGLMESGSGRNHFHLARASTAMNVEVYGPSEAGFPIYVQRSVPLVMGVKGDYVAQGDLSSYSVHTKTIPVVNTKVMSNMGVISPFSNQFVGSGVEMSAHFSLPLAMDIKYSRGKLDLSLKTPEEIGKEIEMMHIFIKPYTVAKNLRNVKPFDKSSSVKEILSGQPRKEFDYRIGESLGYDAKIKVMSDYKHFDFPGFINTIRRHNLHSVFSLATFMPPSARQNSIKLVYNPRSSSTKEIEATFSFVTGMKSGEQSEIALPLEEDISEQKEMQIEAKCHQKHSEQFKIDLCIEKKSKVLKFDRVACDKTKKMLSELGVGVVRGLSMHASIKTHSSRKTISSLVVFGSKREGRNAKSMFEARFKLPNRPYWEVRTTSETEFPFMPNRWNVHSLIEQDIELKMKSKMEYGYSTGQRHVIELDAIAKKSHELKSSVRNSQEFRKCEHEVQRDRVLASVCEELRHQAGSVDKIYLKLKVPSHIKENRYFLKLESALSSYFVYQMSYKEHRSGEPNTYLLEGKIRRGGDSASVNMTTPHAKLYVRHIRVPRSLRGLAPVSVRDDLSLRLLQATTRDQAPASCRLDATHISTFDNKTYEYRMNECEHLLFKDCSGRSGSPIPIAVLALKTRNGGGKTVKVLSGKNTVELRYQKPGTVGGGVYIHVNGRQMSIPAPTTYVQRDASTGRVELVVRRYSDQVVTVTSPDFGMETLFDGKRIEVVAPQYLKNRVCGLCGDLNGESTADLKTPKMCVMKEPRFAAYSYMLRGDAGCPGIPQSDRSAYEREAQQCAKKHYKSTPVEKLARYYNNQSPVYPVSQMHYALESPTEVCLTRQRLRVCPRGTRPEKVRAYYPPFACVTRPSLLSEQLIKRADAGDMLEEIESLPIAFSKRVFEPTKCVRHEEENNEDTTYYPREEEEESRTYSPEYSSEHQMENTPCPDSRPVCGDDNRTYRNRCEASKRGMGYKCKFACPCPECHECPYREQTVCGKNNHSYRNSCRARCLGVDVKCEGRCPCRGGNYRTEPRSHFGDSPY